MSVTETNKAKSVVFIQLTGGNDALNTVIPYTDQNYFDHRPSVAMDPDKVLKLDQNLALNPNMVGIKSLWDQGKVAIINGIGYPNPIRSHFRSMDIWHTAEPEKVLNEGWLGKASRAIDPKGENALTSINFGRGLPRALSAPGVPVASVGDLSTYGLFPNINDEHDRASALNLFSQMYGGSGADMVREFIRQTGVGAYQGADILKTAPENYQSNIEYADSPMANNLKDAAQVMFSDFGTRIFYTQRGSFDTHSGEVTTHSKLIREVSDAVYDFQSDLDEHEYGGSNLTVIFTEFGRRIKDNGSGTDHGSGGVAFVIGDSVNGGLYGEFPSLAPKDQVEGDMKFNNDFRSTYSTILDDWLDLDAPEIVNGNFEKMDFLRS